MASVVILILLGVALLALETVLPGMIAGFVGLGCIVSGIVSAYANFGAKTGNLVLFLCLGGLTAGTLVWMKYFPRSPMAKLFISRSTTGDLAVEQPSLVNESGTALTVLRPSGTALIAGRRVDVVTEGGLIERGAPVKVVAVEGLRVVVRPV